MLKINYGSLMLTVVYYNRYTALPAKTGVPLGVYKVAVETTNQYTCSGVKGKGTVFNFLFFLGVPGVLLALGACMMRGWGGGGVW